jgi:XTP/dITP diphosphohydrolase
MDKLRSDGPWESEQTHDSLRRYLLEETYELFDAVRSGKADDLRDELGDVLLQVLFHARIAEDAPQHPFTIDDVADALLRKLGNRVPGVIAGKQISLEQQIAEWDARKAQERAVKSRGSCLDGVPTGQPALALAQKVLGRVADAGLPADLIPAAMTTVTVAFDGDAENDLRSEILEFVDMVHIAERTIAATRRGSDVPEQLDSAVLDSVTEDEWRAAWPVATEPAPSPDAVPEPTSKHVPEPGPVEVPEPSPVEVPEPSPEQVAENGVAAAEEDAVPALGEVDAASNGHPNSA